MSTDRLSMRHTEESRRAVDALRGHLFREGLILTESEVVRWALVVMARRVVGGKADDERTEDVTDG